MNGNNPIRLSVCVVVRNEEALIGRCLESLRGQAAQIILVHDGPCQDRTLEMAAAHGARCLVVGETSVGEAEPLRQISYEQARGEWILQLDADEFLSPELAEVLPSLMADGSIDAYEAVWPLYDGQRYRTQRWPRKRCLFRRSAIAYLGIPHFVVTVPGRVKRIPERLEHQPAYDNVSWHTFRRKWLPWATLQAALYLQPLAQVPSFQFTDKHWPRSVQFRRQWPLIALLIDPLISGFRQLADGAGREGAYAWRYVGLTSFFRIALDWNIFLLKYFR